MAREDKGGENSSGVNEAALCYSFVACETVCCCGKPSLRKTDTTFVTRILGWIKKRKEAE